MDMLTIDGSQGEGGGQILRSSLALSAITGTPIRIEKIRARRPKPGLQRQHLVAVQAAARVSCAEITGDTLDSRELTFRPQQAVAGTYDFDIGSAGSITLVLQTILPILLHAEGTSTVSIRGGTHNGMAPPVEFLRESFLPALNTVGISAAIELERHGFYPAGGGAIRAVIHPWTARAPLDLRSRGKAIGRHAEAIIANLPAHVAARESQAIKHALHWSHQEVDEREVEADGPGNALIARLKYANHTTLCSSFGELRKPAEQVAKDCIRQVRAYTDLDAPVCAHLADQLLLPLALGAGGVFRAGEPSGHTRTNAAIIAQFLGDVVAIVPAADGASEITVRGRSCAAA
jgi:RNA 3'-terminal phosphate cyclase (ATP)